MKRNLNSYDLGEKGILYCMLILLDIFSNFKTFVVVQPQYIMSVYYRFYVFVPSYLLEKLESA